MPHSRSMIAYPFLAAQNFGVTIGAPLVEAPALATLVAADKEAPTKKKVAKKTNKVCCA